MLRDTFLSQYASTHQIWNSYLKEYRRYALDRKRDRRTDGGMDKAITICLPEVLWGHKNSFVKKAELMISANRVYIIKPESPSDGRCFIVILT